MCCRGIGGGGGGVEQGLSDAGSRMEAERRS